MIYSILQDNRVCWLCGTNKDIHAHHVFFGTANRKLSDEDGMVVFLCGPHHNMSSAGVHFNHDLDAKLKDMAQKIWMEKYTDKEDSNDEKLKKFIKRYGRNYLLN